MTTSSSNKTDRNCDKPNAPLTLPKSRSKLTRGLTATGLLTARLTRLPLLGDVTTGGLRRFNEGASLFSLVAMLWLGFAASSAAQTINWNGAGVTGGSGNAVLNTNGNWTGGSAPTSTQIGSISLNTTGGNLTQSANLNWARLFFTTRSGTNRGTITLSLNNHFGSVTAGGFNTIVLSGGSTSVGGIFDAGNGTNPFHLVFTNAPTLSSGTITVANASRIVNANDNDNIVSVVAPIVLSSGASLMTGGDLSNGSDPVLRLIGNVTVNSGGILFNAASQNSNNDVGSSLLQVIGLLSNNGVVLVRASAEGNGQLRQQFNTLSITGDFFNSGITTITANDAGNNASTRADATLSVSGVLTNLGVLDLRPESSDNQSTYLVAGRIFLGSTSALRMTSNGTFTLTGNGDLGAPIFSNRITAANAANFAMGTTTVYITGNGSEALPMLWEVNSRATDTGLAQFKVDQWIFNATNSYLKFIAGSQTTGNAQFYVGKGTISNGSILDLNGVGMFINSGSFNLDNGTIRDSAGGAVITIGTSGTLIGQGTIAAVVEIVGNTITATGAGLDVTGKVKLNGKAISGNTVRNYGTIEGNGAVRAPLQNKNTGRVIVTGGNLLLDNATAPINQGTILVQNFRLDVTNASWTNDGTLIIDGGSVRVGGGTGVLRNALYVSTGSSIDGHFSNAGIYDLTNHSSITGNFTNAATGVTNTNGNELKVNGAAGVSNAGIINVNAGTLNSATVNNTLGALIQLAGGGVKGTTLSNDGTISGYGEFDINANNSGNIQATGGTLNIGAHSIGGLGGVDVASDGALRMQGASVSGAINNAGRIVGTGTLDGSITNTGTIITTDNFHMETAPSNTGTILVGAHRLNIGAASWLNNGWVEVHGGSIRVGGGSGLLTNALYISTGSSIDGNFTNSGSFELTDHSSITGNFNNTSTGWATLNGFELQTQGALGATNDGTIIVGVGTLNTVNTLVNNLGALITLAGGGIKGGNISNIGDIEGNGIVDAPVSNLFGGNFTANGGSVRFLQNVVNNGALNLGAGGEYRFNANLANIGDGNTGGLIGGIGTYTFAPTTEATFSNSANTAAALGGIYDTRSITFAMDSGIVNVEVASTDIGSSLAAIPANGFSVGTLILPNTLSLLRLLDQFDNQSGGGKEAIYTENLMLGDTLTAANFDFSGASLKIYYNNIIGGTGFQSSRVTYFGNIIPLNLAPPPPPPPLGVVPEPSTIILMLLGLPLLAYFAWRRARKTA
jgi:filamentous hemagglutinin